MREKMAEILSNSTHTISINEAIEQILALFPSLEGIEHVEECPYAHPFREEFLVPCLKCNGTGTITRQAEWGDIDVKAMIRDILFTKNYFPSLSTKSGGRLRMKK
jgi:hypothetical protein